MLGTPERAGRSRPLRQRKGDSGDPVSALALDSRPLGQSSDDYRGPSLLPNIGYYVD